MKNTNSTGQNKRNEQRANESGRIEWLRWPSGFEIQSLEVTYKGQPAGTEDCLVPKRPTEQPTKYYPEDHLEAILDDFTRIENDATALRFAKKHGLLRYPRGSTLVDGGKFPDGPFYSKPAEALSDWIDEVRRIRTLVTHWETAKRLDEASLRPLFKTSAEGRHELQILGERFPLDSPTDTPKDQAAAVMRVIAHEMNHRLSNGFRGRLNIDKSGRPHLSLTADRLMDWICLTIAHGLVERPEPLSEEIKRRTSQRLHIRFCEECGYPLFARWAHKRLHTDCRWRREKRELRSRKEQAKEQQDHGQASE